MELEFSECSGGLEPGHKASNQDLHTCNKNGELVVFICNNEFFNEDNNIF